MFEVEHKSGKELIQSMVSDDWGPPPRSMVLEACTDDGKRVVISIPYSDSETAFAKIEEMDG